MFFGFPNRNPGLVANLYETQRSGEDLRVTGEGRGGLGGVWVETTHPWQRVPPNVDWNNDVAKFLPEGAVGDEEEMAQLDGEPVLCRGPEAAEAPLAGQQRRQRRHAAVHPEQEQLPDPHVQPDGGER